MKFLKGKVWQIALAVCLLVALMCIVVGAEAQPATASITIAGTACNVTEEDESTYAYFTTAEGNLVPLGEEDDKSTYNVKVAYDGEYPTIYLKGAAISAGDIAIENTTTTTWQIKTETDSSITQTNTGYANGALKTAGKVIFTGEGKLTVTANRNFVYGTASTAKVEFKDTNMKVVTQAGTFNNSAGGGSLFYGTVSQAVFDNAEVYFDAYYIIFRAGSTEVEISNGSNVTFDSQISVVTYAACNFTITDSRVIVKASDSSTRIFERTTSLSIENSYFEATNAGSKDILPLVPTYSADIYAVSGASKAAATEYDRTTSTAPTGKYLKIAPGGTVTVENGTAKAPYGTPAGKTIKAFKDDTVTLTANAVSSGQRFDGWTTTNQNITIASTSAMSTTFKMPEGDVSVKANYTYEATIQLVGQTVENCTFTDEVSKYFTTDDAGAITPYTGNDAEEKYNIKLAFDDTLKLPAVYLRGAKIVATETNNVFKNVSGTGSFAIITEVVDEDKKIDTGADIVAVDGRDDQYVDSYITHAGGYAIQFAVSGGVTFSGDGLLKIQHTATNGNSMNAAASAQVNFNEADVVISHGNASTQWGNGNFTLAGSIQNVNVTGGKVTIFSDYILTNININFNVGKDADVCLIAKDQPVTYSVGNITVDGGRMYVQANNSQYPALYQIRGITVNSGELEIWSKLANSSTTNGNGNDGAAIAISSLYEGSYAVMGSSKSSAKEYKMAEGETSLPTLSGQYFKIGKAATVTVENGTAKAFGVDSVANADNPSIHTVKTIAGSAVTVTATETAGMALRKWTLTNGSATFADSTVSPATITPTGDVSVKANLAKVGSVTIAGVAYTVYQGEDALYFTTNGSGAVSALTSGDKEANYNIKFVYPADEIDGDKVIQKLPVVYLNGAYIGSGDYSISSNANSSADGTVIVVEKDKTYTIGEGESAVTVNAYLTKRINWSKGTLTIKGYEGTQTPAAAQLGKLKLDAGTDHCIVVSGQQIVVENLDLELVTTGSVTACFNGTPKKIVFNGGKAKATASYAAVFVTSGGTTIEGVEINNNAYVEILSTNNDGVHYWNYTPGADSLSNAALVVNSGYISVKTTKSGNVGWRSECKTVTVNGGTLELSGLGGAGYQNISANLANYKNGIGEENYYVTAGTTAGSATEMLTGDSFELYNYGNRKYIKIEPAYNIGVTNGTASVTVNGIANKAATKAPAGTTVTLNAPTVAGKAFVNWTNNTIEEANKDKYANAAFNKAENATTTFEMPAKNVGVTANYELEAKILLNGITHTFTESKPAHFTTDESGIISEYTEADAATKYNIKLEYVGSIPTVHLKGAYIAADNAAIQNGANTPEFAIKTEVATTKITAGTDSVDSYITYGNTENSTSRAVNTSGKLTFNGSGVLKMEGKAKAGSIYSSSGATQDVVFDGANVLMYCYGTGGSVQAALATGPKAYVFQNNANVYAKAEYAAVFQANITVTSGAKLTLSGGKVGHQTLYGPSNTVTVDGGSLDVQGTSSNMIQVAKLDIKSGEFLATTTGTNVLNVAPTLSEYSGYFAVAGTSKAGATEYTAGNDLPSGCKYLRVGTPLTVTVTGGTAKMFAVKSAADPEKSNVHTLKTFANETVTVTAGEAAVGYGFKNWSAGQNDKVTFGDSYEATTTFTMPANNVSIVANTDSAADVKIGSTTYTAVKGGKVHYYLTSNGAVAGKADGNTYNFKFEYPADVIVNEEAVPQIPTVTLRDAYISGAITNGTNTAATTKIVVLATDQNVKVYTSDPTVDSYLSNTITWAGGALEIHGPGKLRTSAINVTNQTLTFNGLNLVMSAGTGFGAKPTSITFNGGTADIDTSFLGTNFTAATTITITNGANVDWVSANAVFYGVSGSNVVVQSGYLHAETENKNGSQGVTHNFGVTISGGTVELYSPYYVGSFLPVISNYSDPAGTTYCAAYGRKKDGTNTSPWFDKYGGTNYQYFKVEPAYKIAVDGGYSNDWTSWPAGKTITMSATCTRAEAGKGLQHWYTEDVDDETYNDNFITFTMPEKNVTIKPVVDDLVQVQVTESSTVSAVKGGATRYYRIVENDDESISINKVNVASADSPEPAYNFKFVYAANGTPTLTLNNVVLEEDGRIHCGTDILELIVVLEGENSLLNDASANGEVVKFAGSSLEFTGTGTLKLQSKYRVIQMTGASGAELTFDNVTMDLITTGHWQMCVDASNGTSVTVSGGELYMQGRAFEDAAEKPGSTALYNGTLLTVTNDAVITIPVMNIAIGTPLNMESGTIIIGADVLDDEGQVLVAGNVRRGFGSKATINGGTVEVFATENVSGSTMNLAGYVDGEGNILYAAVANTSKDAFMADPVGSVYNNGDSLSDKQYFRIEPKLVQVTITWGAMTFNYNGSIWDTENLTWVGNWEPSNEVEDGVASNQIKVVNTGTEIVDVKFEFATADTFITNYEANITGTFTDGEGTTITDATITLIRFAEANAYLNLNSASIASNFGSTTLGTVTVTIDALTPAQGGNA